MNRLIPGSLVSVMVGPIEHYGVVSDSTISGMPCIISNSRRAGQVAEEPANVFASGKQIKLLRHPGHQSPAMIISRARSQIGKAYSLLNWNCEHFIRWVFGQKVESPQLQTAFVTGLALLGLFFLATKSR